MKLYDKKYKKCESCGGTGHIKLDGFPSVGCGRCDRGYVSAYIETKIDDEKKANKEA